MPSLFLELIVKIFSQSSSLSNVYRQHIQPIQGTTAGITYTKISNKEPTLRQFKQIWIGKLEMWSWLSFSNNKVNFYRFKLILIKNRNEKVDDRIVNFSWFLTNVSVLFFELNFWITVQHLSTINFSSNFLFAIWNHPLNRSLENRS